MHTNKKDVIDKGNLKELSLEIDSIVLSTMESRVKWITEMIYNKFAMEYAYYVKENTVGMV